MTEQFEDPGGPCAPGSKLAQLRKRNEEIARLRALNAELLAVLKRARVYAESRYPTPAKLMEDMSAAIAKARGHG